MKLLCIGDIHLGRRPARLPESVTERVAAAELGPAAAWRRAVEFAIEAAVDHVLLAGDVVEQENDFYEAYADLRAGVERLIEAGIGVLGVAGNHDVAVLPRLADAVPAFRLLGRGGAWEAVVLEGRGGGRTRLLGWSFPQSVVPFSPLDEGLPPREADLAVIGLLHCDRDQSGSRHAPVHARELAEAPVDAWLLGHIHKPDPLAAPRPMGYLGSLTGLDPGEPGAHGPWLLGIEGDGALSIDQVPLAPLRWETIEVTVDELGEAGDVHGRIIEALNSRAGALAAATGHAPRALGCRVHLTGRTALRRELERTLRETDPHDLDHEHSGIVCFVHAWRLQALPAVDLEALARDNDPVGLLARKLQVLRGGEGPGRRAMIEAARRALAAVARQPVYKDLDPDVPDDAAVATVLEAAALRALDDLLAQREPPA